MELSIENGYVAINGAPQFIVSGEIQYFRLEKETWGAHLDKLKEAGCNTVSTYIPWVWHETAKNSFDFDGSTHPSRDLKTFLKLVKDKGLYFVAKIGPNIHAEYKNGGVPDRLFEEYDGIESTDSEGKPTANYIFYRTTSYLQPDFMKETKVWYHAVVPHLLAYDNIVCWQVDNETSYNMAWFSHGKGDNFSCDYNPHIVHTGLYQEYLADIYGNNHELLNKKYHENNPSFSVVIPPRKEATNRAEEAKVKDWIGFKEILPALYTRSLMEELYSLGVRAPFVINEPFVSYVTPWKRYLDTCKDKRWTVVLAYTQYQGGVQEDSVVNHISRIEYTKASETPLVGNVEIQACNAYFISHRNQTTSDYDLLWRSGVGTGINTINYYWFSDGFNFDNTHHFVPQLSLQSILDPKANPRPHYETCKKISTFLTDHPEIAATTPVYDITVAFNHDYAQYAKMDNSRDVTHFEIQNNVSDKGSGILDILDYINCRYQLINSESSFDRIETNRLVVHSETFMCRDYQAKLVSFVENGGRLCLMGHVPTLDENLEGCTLLMDALDIDEVDHHRTTTAAYEGVMLQYKEYNFYCINDIEYFSFQNHSDITVDMTNPESGAICAFTRTIGNGSISVIGFPPRLFFDITKDIYADYFKSEPTPFQTILKRSAPGIDFHTVLNFDDHEKVYLFHDDEYRIGPRSGKFFLKSDAGVFVG
ncbi:MAG: beta-galactosidase [Fibrobacterales bacterium]